MSHSVVASVAGGTRGAASRNPNAPGTRRPFLKSIHDFVLRNFRIDGKRFFARALASNSARLLVRRLEGSPHRRLLESEDLTGHYADFQLKDGTLSSVLLSFIAGRIEFMEARLGREEIERSTFVDVGDTSGIFIKALGKRSLSMNISKAAAESIERKGLRAVLGDGTRLPIRDDGCDYVLCFETLEHLPNPLGALAELYRVCRKGAFISVPHVSRTTVYPPKFMDFPQELLHIFELSRVHWDALIAHTPFIIDRVEVIPVIDRPRGVREAVAMGVWRLLFGLDVFCMTYSGFLTYHLAKRGR